MELHTVSNLEATLFSTGLRSCPKCPLGFGLGGAFHHLLDGYLPNTLCIVTVRGRQLGKHARLSAKQGVVRRSAVNGNQTVPGKDALREQKARINHNSFLLKLGFGSVPLLSQHGASPLDVLSVLLWSPWDPLDAMAGEVLQGLVRA